MSGVGALWDCASRVCGGGGGCAGGGVPLGAGPCCPDVGRCLSGVNIIITNCKLQMGHEHTHMWYIWLRKSSTSTWPLQDILLLSCSCARIKHPFILPAHLHRPHWCNTIARLLGSIAHLIDPSRMPMMIVYPRKTPPHIRTARAQPAAAHRRRHSRSHHRRHEEHSPTARQPHSNGLCSPPKEGPGPGSALKHVDAGLSTKGADARNSNTPYKIGNHNIV